MATIDLGEVERIERIELRALHEIKPWIWSPRRVLFSASDDGFDFDVVAIVNSDVAEDDAEIQIERFICDEAFDTRYVQIEAQGHGPIPEWHLGRGNDRWMFLDEVVLELGQ